MTRGASEPLEPVSSYILKLWIASLGVTFAACDGKMRALQREASVLMCAQRERRWTECFHRVTALAPVQPRRGLELSSVSVAVAVGALRELDLVNRGSPRRNMTLRACDRYMPSF